MDSLELWVSLTWLASHTQHIQFGSLVSPLPFRHPTMTARMATAVDDLSGGRLVLGLGAGWQEREHTHFGFSLLDIKERFRRFEEGLEVITRLMSSDEPVDFQGKYFSLKDAILLPRPIRAGGPPILVGGNGERYTLPLVARYASEWNAVFIGAKEFQRLDTRLDELLRAQGRPPKDVRRSLMTGCVFGRDRAEVNRKVEIRTQGKSTVGDLSNRGLIVGTAPEIVEQLEKLEQAGLQRIMLQWLDLDDLTGLEAMAKGII
jgi:alkanesulfonate monooxygenase SsuD/methylene tetrahydromethanopterin reductase-like flavin-dependent oxidoreductase (luciferase family)